MGVIFMLLVQPLQELVRIHFTSGSVMTPI